MSRRFTNIILALVLTASLFAIYEGARMPEQQPAARSARTAPATRKETVWPVVTATAQNPPTKPGSPNERTVAARQLQTARDLADIQAQRLAALKAQQAQQIQLLNLTNPNLMSERTMQIQNLSDLLGNQRLAEQDLNRAAQENLSLQSSNAQFMRDQIDINIQQTIENIQQLQAQMQSRAQGPLPPELATASQQQQQDEAASFQNTLAAQYEQLDALREQRVQVSANSAGQTSLVQAQVQEQRADILADQDEIQNQIFSIRDEIRNVQNSNTQIRMSLIPLAQQIEQAQKNYELTQSQLSALESSSAQSIR